jgi:hypothetical protein
MGIRAAATSLLLVLAAACAKEPPAGPADRAGSSDPPQNLGFLGATGSGAPSSLALPDPAHEGEQLHAGGVVIREIAAGAPLARAGVRAGDVLVRVADDFLPNKENPALDLLARIERAHTAGKNQIELGYLRAGRLEHATLELDPEAVPPLDPGSLEGQARYTRVANSAMKSLAGLQRENGSFPAARAEPDAELAVSALAGLALQAGRTLPDAITWEPALAKARTFVAGALAAPPSSPVALAFATLFLAELAHAEPTDAELNAALADATQKLASAQREDGHWELAGGDTNAELGFNERTLATELCVQALGAAERAGATVDNALFERAFALLKKSTSGGKVGFRPEPGFDRRSEAARLAGILAAMRSAGCDLTDPYLDKLFAYYTAQAKEIGFAPLDESLPLFWSALVARQKGLPQWMVFNYENQVLLLSLQAADGSFTSLPKPARKSLPVLDDCLGAAWHTAIFSLILALQEDELPILCPPVAARFAKRRDTDAKVSEQAATAEAAAAPKGAMQFQSLDEAIEALKKMGLKDDDPQIKQLQDLQKQMKKD